MTAHRLDPLLAPGALALMGASPRPKSPGREMLDMAVGAGFGGRLYPVNPGYEAIEGRDCYPDLAALPETVDHVALAVSNERLEQSLAAAIDHGARAVTIFASCILDPDPEPTLLARVRDRAREAGLQVCGGNGMGFYNLDRNLRVCVFGSGLDMEPGGTSLIVQSGSVFGALAHSDRRLKFNLCISNGNEITTTVADYMDYVLDQETTRVIGLFLETVRDPAGFVAALQKAERRGVPVVALKVGRTPLAAAMAQTHSGALVGDDAAYQALFQRYGVLRVESHDELAASLLAFQGDRRAAAGDLVTIHDSGGEREMLVDLADDLKVPLATIGEATKARLRARLDPGLEAENPLDAWGTGHDYEGIFSDCFAALLADPQAALGGFFVNLRNGHRLSEGYAAACLAGLRGTEKPVFLVTNFSALDNREILKRMTAEGLTVIDGAKEGLLAMKHMLAFRDHQARQPGQVLAAPPAATVERWHRRLASGAVLDEAEGLALLSDFGIPVPAFRRCASEADLRRAAAEIDYPLALKTAAPGIAHKSDRGGVVLGLPDEDSLSAAYRAMSARLGPEVLVSAMAPAGVEIGLGVVKDPDFGPFLVVSAGGLLIELLDDKAVALAPCSDREAEALLAALKVARLLEGPRGQPPCDKAALLLVIQRLSVLAACLAAVLDQLDINPVIVGPGGALAVDALVIPHRKS